MIKRKANKMNIDTFKTTSKDQKKFIDSNAQVVIWDGGRGVGKTCAGAIKAIRSTEKQKKGVIISDIRKTIIKHEFDKWTPANKTQRFLLDQFVLNNTQLLILNFSEVEQRLRGLDISWIWFDLINVHQFSEMRATIFRRLRSEVSVWITTLMYGGGVVEYATLKDFLAFYGRV